MVRRARWLAVLVLCSCNPGWKPASVIDSMRVIGMRAEPPEIQPGKFAALDALIVDPTRPNEKNTMLWLGCDPDPFGNRGACVDLGVLEEPASLLDAGSVRIIGIDNRAGFAAPPDIFDVMLPDGGSPDRVNGTAGVVVSIAVAADVPITATMAELQPVLAKIQSKEIASQVSLFRVLISENPAPNHNPFIDDVLVNGEKLPAGATILLQPQNAHVLELTAHDLEEYDTPLGEHKTEKIIVAWYTTAGRFDGERQSLGGANPAKLIAPGDIYENDPIPDDRRGTLWAVIRDTRGGQTWRAYPWLVCEETAPMPWVQQVERGASALTLRGENLENIVNVVAGEVALKGSYVSGLKAWVGDPTSEELLTVRAKSCVRVVVR